MSIEEPRPQTQPEQDALARMCPSCFAHEGEWCATAAARNHYTRALHPARFAAAVPVVQTPEGRNE